MVVEPPEWSCDFWRVVHMGHNQELKAKDWVDSKHRCLIWTVHNAALDKECPVAQLSLHASHTLTLLLNTADTFRFFCGQSLQQSQHTLLHVGSKPNLL